MISYFQTSYFVAIFSFRYQRIASYYLMHYFTLSLEARDSICFAIFSKSFIWTIFPIRSQLKLYIFSVDTVNSPIVRNSFNFASVLNANELICPVIKPSRSSNSPNFKSHFQVFCLKSFFSTRSDLRASTFKFMSFRKDSSYIFSSMLIIFSLIPLTMDPCFFFMSTNSLNQSTWPYKSGIFSSDTPMTAFTSNMRFDKSL